jgi:hypothetical protein
MNNIVIDDIHKVSEERLRTDLEDDTFCNKLTREEKEELINLIKGGRYCAGHIFNKIWYGEIKICPTCKKVRVTSCCACGCGSCETCGYRWTCLPVNFPEFKSFIPNFNLQDIVNAQPFNKEYYKDYII